MKTQSPWRSKWILLPMMLLQTPTTLQFQVKICWYVSSLKCYISPDTNNNQALWGPLSFLLALGCCTVVTNHLKLFLYLCTTVAISIKCKSKEFQSCVIPCGHFIWWVQASAMCYFKASDRNDGQLCLPVLSAESKLIILSTFKLQPIRRSSGKPLA